MLCIQETIQMKYSPKFYWIPLFCQLPTIYFKPFLFSLVFGDLAPSLKITHLYEIYFSKTGYFFLFCVIIIGSFNYVRFTSYRFSLHHIISYVHITSYIFLLRFTIQHCMMWRHCCFYIYAEYELKTSNIILICLDGKEHPFEKKCKRK